MKTQISIFILFSFILSFANVYAQDAKTDKYISVDAEQNVSDLLNEYLLSEDVLFLEEAKTEFSNIKSSTDLANFYNITIPKIHEIIYRGIAVSNPDVMYAGDSEPVETWAFFNNYMPYIAIEVMCSECDAGPYTNVVPLMEVAFNTPQKDDDAFFEIIEIIFWTDGYGRETVWDGGGNLGDWHTMDGCDFCSYSNLGSGNLIDILTHIQEAKEAGNNFDERLAQLKSNTLSYMYADHYAGSKKEVLDEINKILNRIELSEDEILEINDNKTRIETNTEIQYNCEDGGCEYDW